MNLEFDDSKRSFFPADVVVHKTEGFLLLQVCFFVALYYNVIIAWSLFYMGNSFQYPLPWERCPTDVVTNDTGTKTAFWKCLSEIFSLNAVLSTVKECARSSPTSYFWFRKALNITNSIEESGEFNPIITGCLVAAWAIVALAMIKGIKSSAKVRWSDFI